MQVDPYFSPHLYELQQSLSLLRSHLEGVVGPHPGLLNVNLPAEFPE